MNQSEMNIRSLVAKQIRTVRSVEFNLDFNRNRSGDDYLRELVGVSAFFKHIRTLPSDLIVDIGAGSTKGIYELSQLPEAKGLRFSATVLKRDYTINQYLGYERTILTSGEVLRKVKDIGGVIAVLSIAYSVAPNLVVETIKSKMVPGAILKAVFPQEIFRYGLQQSNSFIEALQRNNFGVAVDVNEAKSVGFVVVAINEGTQELAQNILNEDAKLYFLQQKRNRIYSY